MIRFLEAIAWLRWRLLAGSLRGGRRRDELEQLSRITSLVARTLLLIMFLGGAAVLAGLALAAGWAIGTGSAEPAPVLLVARLLLLVVLGLLVLVPAGNPAPRGIAHPRLLLLPIPHRSLHVVEVLAGLADPWVAIVPPALLLFALGLLAAGRAGASLVALAGAAGTLIVLASMGSLLSFLMAWLMRNRSRGELVTLISILVISVISFVPATISENLEGRTKSAGRRRELSIERLDEKLPAWSRALPSELYGRSVQAGVEGRFRPAVLGVLFLLLEGAALFGASSAVYRKLIASEAGGGRRRAGPGGSFEITFPGLTAAASAVALAQARTAMRSVRGRLAVLMPGLLVAGLGLLTRLAPGAVDEDLSRLRGPLLLGAALLLSLLTLSGFTMNQFAADRAGLTLQFLAPISDEELVKGKAVGCALFFGSSTLICLLMTLLVSPGGSLYRWLVMLLGAGAAYVLTAPGAAFLSAVFPVASDLSSTGNRGNPHTMAHLIGVLLVGFLSTPPALLLFLVDHRMGRPALSVGLAAIWTVLAIVVSLPLLNVAARAVGRRRENLALVAQSR